MQLKPQNVVTQPEPSPSPNVDPPLISSPLPVASTSGVSLDEIPSSPSDDKVRKFRKSLIESDMGFSRDS